MPSSALPAPPLGAAQHLRCQLCSRALSGKDHDDLVLGACARCIATKPAKVSELAMRSGIQPAGRPAAAAPFNDAEKALVSRLGGLSPLPKLLQLINDRRQADKPGAPLVTLQQLQEEHQSLSRRPTDSGWLVTRRLLADARATGVLQQVTTEVIDDFAIVFQLNRVQVLHLKDVLLGDGEDD